MQGTAMAKTKQRITTNDATKITGEPTSEDMEHLQSKLVEIAVKFDTEIFMEEMNWDTYA